MIMMKRKARGFSLLELLLVVGVGAVLILAGLSAYRLVSEGNAATQSVRHLQTLKQQIQQAYQGEVNYGSTSLITALQNMRMLPPDMIPNDAAAATSVRNAFNNTTTAVGTGATGTFTITFNGVTPTACNKMGTMFSTATASDFVGLTVGSTTLTQPTVANLAAPCDVAGGVTMVWEFR